MRKKKGYALLLVIMVISLLIVLSTTVLSLSTLGYISTKRVEENNKLKLVAESGIEKANMVLKNYILEHPNVLMKPNEFNPADLNSLDPSIPENELSGISCKITFSPDITSVSEPYDDILTGRQVQYIKIIAKATNKKGRSKTVSEVLDKRGIYNTYFNKIFHGSLTVADEMNNDQIANSFEATNTILKLSGSMFLQGKNINFKPITFNMDEGAIYVKSNNFISDLNHLKPGGTINLLKNDISGKKDGWTDTTIREIKLLNIIKKADGNQAEEMHNLNNDSSMVNINSYIKLVSNTILSYKVESSSQIDFKTLVDGADLKDEKGNPIGNGIYYTIIEKLKMVPEYKDNYRDKYGTFYKLLLIDGNLVISDNTIENFDNYLIYCTGTVTFEGEAHFYNSSIFAKKIQFSATTPAKEVEFYGVRTAKALAHEINQVPNNNLKDFNDVERASINTYLINNLEGYGDYIEFKTLEWKE